METHNYYRVVRSVSMLSGGVSQSGPFLASHFILTNSGGEESRVSDFYPLMHKMQEDSKFKWKDPPENPNLPLRVGMQNRLRVLAYCHHEAIADAAVKFGTIPSAWARSLENGAPCPSWEITTRIAMVVDINVLKLDVVLPTFSYSLGLSNKDPITIYILTVGLTESQQCLIRYIMRQPLHPDSKVYTVSADTEIIAFKAHYKGLGHISVATMARLALPQLLPCVSKLIWLDVDTLVVSDLQDLWEIEPSTPCGIAGRTSFSPYTSRYTRPAQLRKKVQKDFKNISNSKESEKGKADGFNAGVLVVNLEKWRTAKFRSLVNQVALEYGNDDQVTLNHFCYGNFTMLPARWNLFYRAGFADGSVDPALQEYEFEKWGIVHWTSGEKPWSKRRWKGKFDKRLKTLWEQMNTTTASALSRPL